MNNDNFKVECIPEPYCDMQFKGPVTRWDEAIPLGNGFMGCLVWGDGFPLRISIDRGDLWDKRVAPEILASDYKYEELIKLVEEGNQEAILKRFDRFYTKPAPTKITAGALELDFGLACTEMTSRLHLSSASCDMEMVFGGKNSRIRTYLHATGFLGYISVSGNAGKPRLVLKDAGLRSLSLKVEKSKSIKALGYPDAAYYEEGCLSWFQQKMYDTFEYALITGKRTAEDESMEIVYTVAFSVDGQSWLEEAKKKVRAALDKGFDKAFKEHEAWWRNYWEKSAVRICEKEFERVWYINNYLFGSCSRKGFPAMPLQGVWTADDGCLPPWKGDYHHDLNTQMSYWHYMKANHLEEGESFIDHLWSLVPEARRFAREFFDAQGICLPSVMSIDGKSLGGWPMYSTNLVNQIWLCQAFDHYWQYTGDVDFLKNKAYPYFRETAECILRWLKPGDDGKLVLPLSSSPELHDNTLGAWLTANSNNDLSLMIYLFKTLLDMSEVLENGEKAFWENKLGLMPELALNSNNVLMISPEEELKESHRHFSHAMAIYPLKLFDYHEAEGNARKIIDATIADFELLGTGLWAGSSFTWMADLYAVQGNGEGAAYQIKLFWENFCSQNGFCLNGDFKKRGLSTYHIRPFTLEGNMCAADAIQEMLLQDNGIIKVFPAIPEEWRKNGVRFYTLRGRNGVLVSSSIKNGTIEFITLKAGKKGAYKVQNTFDSSHICLNSQMIEVDIGECIDINLDEDEICTICVNSM